MSKLPLQELKKLNEFLCRSSLSPQEYTHLIKTAIRYKSVESAKLIHAHIFHSGGCASDINMQTQFMNAYAKCGAFPECEKIFKSMPTHDMVSVTTMITQYAKYDHHEQALQLYSDMVNKGMTADQMVFSCIIPASTDLQVLKILHAHTVKVNFTTNVFVGSSLVDLYCKYDKIDLARHLFDKMRNKNVVTWTAMISGYVNIGSMDEAYRLFLSMPQRNVVTFTIMMSGLAKHGMMHRAFEMFRRIPAKDFCTWNTLLGHCAESGYFHEAMEIFEKMPNRDVRAWTVIISGFARNGHLDAARKLFDEMPTRDTVSWNAMIAGYVQNGRVDEAYEVFLRMPGRNLLSWTPIIAGYVTSGDYEKALGVFRDMVVTGLKVNSTTYSSALPACAKLGLLQKGQEIHQDIIRNGLKVEADTCLASALINMYAKCGKIASAKKLFEDSVEDNLHVWNSMMSGYAMHGNGYEALHLFEDMKKSTKLVPDGITFVAILSACCHCRLLHEGCMFFHLMTRHYRISPILEHYCCMVDLFGRAGLLQVAYKFIVRMPLEKQDISLWRSLLAACRTHNNMELGVHVGKCLFELNPGKCADYVLLSNIYGQAQMWEERDKVRSSMKETNVGFVPGSSWLEVNGQLHAFHAGC